MKRILQFFLAKTVALITVFNLAACSIDKFGEIWLITDSTSLDDSGFNTEIYSSAQNWAKKFNEDREKIAKLPGMEIWKNHPMRVKGIVPADALVSTLQENYKIASFFGAKVVIGTSFTHKKPMDSKLLQQQLQEKDTKMVLIDAAADNPVNLASITYNSCESAYLAGIAAWVYLVANYDGIYKNQELKVATFGGVAIEPVVNYQWGFYKSICYANENKLKNELLLKMINAMRDKINKKHLQATDLAKIDVKFINDPENTFTDSFESGKGRIKIVLNNLINDKLVKVIMPVAGQQIMDTVSAVTDSSRNINAQIIGVDIDQSKKYLNASFLTSAKKGLGESVKTILSKAFNLTYDEEKSEYKVKNGEDYFNGRSGSRLWGGKKYAGIVESPAVGSIYKLLNDSDHFWNLAAQSSIEFENVLKPLTDKNHGDWKKTWVMKTQQNN